MINRNTRVEGSDAPIEYPFAWLERIVDAAHLGHDDVVIARMPMDGPHTNHDNQRNRPRDRLQSVAETSGGALAFSSRGGEHYSLLLLGKFEILPMTRTGRFATSQFAACPVHQLTLPGIFMPQPCRLGLQWEPRDHVCNFVRVVKLLEGDMVGDWIVEWCRGTDDPIPVPRFFTNPDAEPANGAPAAERSGRPEPSLTPHPNRRLLDDDDSE